MKVCLLAEPRPSPVITSALDMLAVRHTVVECDPRELADGHADRPRKLYDVDLVTFSDANIFDWNSLPQDGRFTFLASTSRLRYGEHARTNWKPNLHLALWNPYQALDIQSPALMTYGFAAPALEAVNAWLSGKMKAQGRIPVPGFA